MTLNIPERASLEFLKKLAKDRLAVMRVTNPSASLAAAQLAIAREYGFSSWRTLKIEVDRRRAPRIAEFIRACTAGDVNALTAILEKEPALARERVASGSTGLHLAARHPDALRVLLAHGADPNARDAADNASPLHFAAADGNAQAVRLLLDAGSDVHGAGDTHRGGVIGWAARRDNRAVVDILVAHGARHHIFSAMAMSDHALVEQLIDENIDNLSARRSRFECGQTPLHAAFAPPDGLACLTGEPDYALLELLIGLGADLEGKDDYGRTALEVALLRGDGEAIRILRAAGAKEPLVAADADPRGLARLADSVRKCLPMFRVPNMSAAVDWYRSIGFVLRDKYEDSGELVFARLSFGHAELALSPGATSGPRDSSLWLHTNEVEQLYQRLKNHHPFEEDLYSPFYGGRQFSIRDINGLILVFWQPPWMAIS
jgi:ankyrin repeat protein/catechol 2,3-dioxygenase-like lactoylglutathione lyase family enzyme